MRALADAIVTPVANFRHVSRIPFTGTHTSGGAITGGAFVPKGIWPPIYDNTYLFADFTFGQIYHLQLGGSECRTCHPPTSKYKNETFHAASNVADMFFGPSKEGQALYFISVSDLSVRRIRYLGTSNLGPIARAKAFPETILLGDSVYFDGTDSSEPAGNALRFLWVFGDGVNSTEPNPVHAYNHTGLFLVELTVTSATGLFDRAFKQIVVGLPPNLKILSPPEGTTFAVGDFLRLFGEVWYVNGNGVKVLLPTWQWEIRVYHSDHWHPFKEPTPGNNITLGPMPSPEDFVAATNSFVRVILRGTDMDGLPAMMVRDILPRLSYMHLISDPSGMEISVDGSVLVTPALVASWENHDLVVEIEDQDGYNFRTWSNGKDREQVIRMPSSLNGTIKLIAFFDATTDAPTTLPPSSSPTLFPTSPISPPSFTNPSNFPTMLFPSPTTLNTSKVPLKRPIRRDCGPSKPCARCEGHCRYDTDCSDGLICFYKDFGVKGQDSVPGCTGYDLSFTDWCIVGERGMNESIPLVRPLKTYCNREQPCGRCEGHCRDDRGCKSGLVCFKKDSGVVGVDSVPGCIGVDLSKSDWCTTPQAIQQLSAFP